MGDTVIIGAGIIGLSTAFYLSEHSKRKIHLVDSTNELFKCASGLAGGFLASNWFSPPVAPLGALSFKLHAELAAQNDQGKRWGYAPSIATSLTRSGGDADEEAVGGSGEDWLLEEGSRAKAVDEEEGDGNAVGLVASLGGGDLGEWIVGAANGGLEIIGGKGMTAQIDPKKLCEFLLETCRERGVELHSPVRPIGVSNDENGRLSGLKVTNDDDNEDLIPCTSLVLTAGVWTPRLFKTLFPKSTVTIPVTSLGGHSLLYVRRNDRDPEMCCAVFSTEIEGFSPEVFSRRGSELFVAGLNSSTLPVPEIASDVHPTPESIACLKRAVSQLIKGDELELIRESLCFRPVGPGGRPIIGSVSNSQMGEELVDKSAKNGVYVAVGHGAWGISQSLGTGLVVSEMIEGKETSADVSILSLK